MDPREFYETAELLKNHSEQPHIRTSIGRAYYGTFLYFREFLIQNGLEKKKQPSKDIHAFVTECLQFSNVPEGAKAAVRLKALFQSRRDADYNLRMSFTPADSNDRLDEAKKTISDFEQTATPEKKQNIIKNATDFARRKDWI